MKETEDESELSNLKNMLAQSQINANNSKEKNAKRLSAQQILIKLKATKDKRKMEQQIQEINPKINEMNLIADQFERSINNNY